MLCQSYENIQLKGDYEFSLHISGGKLILTTCWTQMKFPVELKKEINYLFDNKIINTKDWSDIDEKTKKLICFQLAEQDIIEFLI